MRTHIVGFLLLLLIPGAAFPQQAVLQSKIDPSTEKYLEWLLTGKGERPTSDPWATSVPLPESRVKEAEGDIWKEIENRKHSYGDRGVWDPAVRKFAHEVLEESGEVEAADQKSRSLSTPPSQWTLRGPAGMEVQCAPGTFYSGRVTALEYHPSTGLHIGAAEGGLWIPFGPFIFPRTDRLNTLKSGAVAVSPSNPATIYYGTGAYSPQAMGGGTGVYKSTDVGFTWQKLTGITPDPTAVSRILIAPWNNNIIFVAGQVGVWRSTDDGSTWSQILYNDCSDLQATASGSVMLAGLPGDGIWKSTDMGTNWASINFGIDLSNVGNVRVGIAPSNNSVGYVLIAKPFMPGSAVQDGELSGIYRTTTLGGPNPSWSQINPTGNLLSSVYYLNPKPKTKFMYGQGPSFCSLVIHPTNSSFVLAGGGTILRTTNAGGNWEEARPPHADVSALLYRASDSLLYAGTDGGVFASTDHGSTWSSALNSLLPTAMYYNIDVSKSNDDVVYGAAQDNYTDGTSPGAPTTWKVQNNGDGIDVVIDWSNPQRIWTTAQDGIVYRTTSGGTECIIWPPTNEDPSFGKTTWSCYLGQDPVDPNWIYYGGGTNLYYSTNQGDNWFPANASPLPGRVINLSVAADGNTVYVMTTHTLNVILAFTRTSTSPPMFTFGVESDPVLPAGRRPIKLIASISAPYRAYALYNSAMQTERIFKRTGGAWQNITGNFTGGIPIHDILEHPADSTRLFLGTDLGVWRSADGGSTWSWWNSGMPNAAIVKDLEYAYDAGGDYLLAGTWGRSMYQRDVSAGTFNVTGLGIPVLSLTNLFPRLLGTSTLGRVIVSTNTGSDWEDSSTPTGADLHGAAIDDSLNMFAVGDSGVILRSSDNGANWSLVISPVSTPLRCVQTAGPSSVFAAGDGGVILRSTDAGLTWDPGGNPFPGSIHSLHFLDQYYGFAAGIDSTNPGGERIVLVTTDGGENWTQAPGATGPGAIFDISFADYATGYASLDNGGVLKTTDGGSTWDSIGTGTTASLYACHFSDPFTGWVSGAGGVFLNTTDGGNSWTAEESGTTDDLRAMTLADDQLFVGSASGILSLGVRITATVSYGLRSDWNLISLPLGVRDSSISTLFPQSSSPAYSYDTAYQEHDHLSIGQGYWMKFPYMGSSSITGNPLFTQTIDLQSGWNLIGSIAASVPVSGIEEDPPGIVNSRYFGYDGGYFEAEDIRPGKAYWVKAGGVGRLTLSHEAFRQDDPLPIDTTAAATGPEGFNSITITDGGGNSAKLYFSAGARDEGRLAALPPAPPAGGFDARFSVGGAAVLADSERSRIVPVAIQSLQYPISIAWNIVESGVRAELRIGSEGVSMVANGSVVITSPGTDIALYMESSGDLLLPEDFALRQNFPNPFNPATAIEYDLPIESTVKVVLFNALGQSVSVLAEGPRPAGRHSIQLDASTLPSGVYFYSLEAVGADGSPRRYSDVRKLVVMK